MNYILKRNFNPKTYAFTDIQLERFDDEQLNSFKSETENTAIIIYETTNINDEHLHKLLNEYENVDKIYNYFIVFPYKSQ